MATKLRKRRRRSFTWDQPGGETESPKGTTGGRRQSFWEGEICRKAPRSWTTTPTPIELPRCTSSVPAWRAGLPDLAPGHLSANRRRGENPVSRIPRFQEHLKTGFTAEAASAARYRAYADRARADGMPNVAQRWLRLAAAKDALAIELLVASEQIHGSESDIGNAISE